MEAQPEDLALALVEVPHQQLGGDRIVHAVVLIVLAAERVGERVALLAHDARAVERRRVARIARLQRLDDVLERHAEPIRDLARARRAAQLGAHRAVDREHSLCALLQVARRPHAPGVVAEVALHLAHHRRHRVGAERDAARRVVAVDRLHQADRRDLDEVLGRHPLRLVAARDRARQRQVALHEMLAQRRVATLAVSAEQQRLSPAVARTASGTCLSATAWGYFRGRDRHLGCPYPDGGSETHAPLVRPERATLRRTGRAPARRRRRGSAPDR